MPGPTRQFRLFVSSTFADLKAERDALRQTVFPRIRELCRAHHATFQPVDLRWGVSNEAARNQNTMRIRLGEIDRCCDATEAPNFIALLGERYGWCPLPEEIPGEEFEDIHAYLTKTGDDVGLEYLDRWYAIDANAVPAVWHLLPREGEFADNDRWSAEERGIAQALRYAVDNLNFSPEQKRRYLASATEQEIAHRDLLNSGDPSGTVSCFVRTIDGLPRDHQAIEYLDFDSDNAAEK